MKRSFLKLWLAALILAVAWPAAAQRVINRVIDIPDVLGSSVADGEILIRQNGTTNKWIGVSTASILAGGATNGIQMLDGFGTNTTFYGTTTFNGPLYRVHSDTYPLWQVYAPAHDNISMAFDAQYNGANWISGSANSNSRFTKDTVKSHWYGATGYAQGATITWSATALQTFDWANSRVGINDESPATALEVGGTVTATAFAGPINGTVGATTPATGAFTTVDTGQGANELFGMDQNVLTTSSPTFVGATLTGDLAVNGDDIASDGSLTITPAGTDLTVVADDNYFGMENVTSEIFVKGTNTLASRLNLTTPNTTVGWSIARNGDALSQALSIGRLEYGNTAIYASTNGNVMIGAASAASTALQVTGTASIGNGSTSSGVLRINEDTDAGSNYASFQVPSLAANTVYVLPADDGEAGEQLQTDGSGNLTWEAAGSGGSGDVTAAANFGTDNRLIRSDGTSKGVQASVITLGDTGAITGVDSITVTNAVTAGSLESTGTGVGILRMKDSDASNYLDLKAPSVISTNAIFIWPGTNGTSAQVLATANDGQLYWKTDATGGGTTMANDLLWNATGDLPYATGNDAGSVLAIGSASQILHVSGGVPAWVTMSGDATISGGALTVANNAVALATDTTGNYVATIADSGASEVTVANSGTENAAVTLALASGITRDTEWDTSAELRTAITDEVGTGSLMFTRSGIWRSTSPLPTAWQPGRTNAATQGTNSITGTTDQSSDIPGYWFDETQTNRITLKMTMPLEWDTATGPKFQFWNSTTNTTASTYVKFWVRGRVVADNGNPNAAWGTAQSATNAVSGTSGYARSSTKTSNVTFSGTPIAGNQVELEIYRDPSDAGDTAVGAAFLEGITMFWKESTTEPSEP